MSKISNTAIIAFAGAALMSLAYPAFGQVDDSKLGKVHFETSCKPEAQKLFDRAMLYQHSFWYRASQKVFDDVLKADPECGIAYWGIALSVLLNPHVAPPAKNLAEGAAAIAKGKSVGAKTERERDYIDALAVMYADYDKVDHRTRILAYAKAMEQLAQRYSQDDEAQIHYALALNTSASPADKTYANQLKGAAILEPIFARQPQHPGVAHYLIHLYDYPPIAEKGLKAARLYAKIAPDAAHAQHMPSHIFTRVGYWQESIDSNAVSQRVAKQAGDFHDQLHAMDYQVYAYLQLGQDTKAKAALDDMTTVKGFTETSFPGHMRWLSRLRGMQSNAPTGRQRRPLRSVPARWRKCRQSRISRERWARPAREILKPRKQTSPNSASCATSCARQKTPIGPSRSIFSRKLRPPGCSTPRASTTTRSRP